MAHLCASLDQRGRANLASALRNANFSEGVSPDEEAFLEADENRDGHLSRAEFKDEVYKLGVRLRGELVARKVGSGVFEVDPVSIFDLFEGQGLPEGKKSVACSMRLRAGDRTLSEKEVNQAFDSIVETIQAQTPYELRK